MAVEVKMPQLGLTMEEGTVSKWVKAGRRCRKGWRCSAGNYNR